MILNELVEENKRLMNYGGRRMKSKKIVGTMVSLFWVISLTACSSNEKPEEASATNSLNQTQIETHISSSEDITDVNPQQYTLQVETSLTPPEGVEEEELQEFSQLVEFYENDSNYDKTKMRYEIYLQKVIVSGVESDEETEVVVVGRVANTENHKSFVGPIAAKKDYVINGEVFEAKTQWWNEGTPYSADSIISSALKEYGISEDELELEHEYVLVSTFEN